MHGAAAEDTLNDDATDKGVPVDEGIDSDDSQYGGWPAIVASDDSDSDDERGSLEIDILEALREVYEAASSTMIGDAWEGWRRQHRQAAVMSTAKWRTYRELLTRDLSA